VARADTSDSHGAAAPITQEVALAGLQAALAGLAERDAKIVECIAKIAERDAKIIDLTAQVALLTENLGRDSSNSHRPPSSDGPGAGSRGKGRGHNKPKSTRKRGGQKGHKGTRRQLVPPEAVHKFIHLFPEACEGCAAKLPETSDSGPGRYQLFELLQSCGLHITEFQRHEVTCDRCGRCTRAAYDSEVIPSSPFGPRLTSVVALLTGTFHMSRRGAQQLLQDLFGLTVSLGAISAMEARASEALVSAADEAERAVLAGAVKYADATSWLLAGLTISLWTMATSMATIYKIFDNGRRGTIQPWFGKLLGILVSDRASVFNFWAMSARQICHAHLIRLFVSFSQRDGPAATIGRELLDLSGLLFEYWHGFKAGLLTRAELQKYIAPVQQQFEAALERAVAADIPRLSGSCANILAHREALWNFVVHEGVEPTNNHAELQLRPLVLWRKRSFGCQSDRGLRFVERIMTVVQTARKQRKNVLDFITASVTAAVRGLTPPALLPTPT